MSRAQLDVGTLLAHARDFADGAYLLTVGAHGPSEAFLFYGRLVVDTGVLPAEWQEPFVLKAPRKLPERVIAWRRRITLDEARAIWSGLAPLLADAPALAFTPVVTAPLALPANIREPAVGNYPTFFCWIRANDLTGEQMPRGVRDQIDQELSAAGTAGWKGLVRLVTGRSDYEYQNEPGPSLAFHLPVPARLEYPNRDTDPLDRATVRALPRAREHVSISANGLGAEIEPRTRTGQPFHGLLLSDPVWQYSPEHVATVEVDGTAPGVAAEVVLSWRGSVFDECRKANEPEGPRREVDLVDSYAYGDKGRYPEPGVDDDGLLDYAAGLPFLRVDSELRAGIEEDLRELDVTTPKSTPKATLLLCGSAVEGILLDCAERDLVRSQSLVGGQPSFSEKVKLRELISIAEKTAILTHQVARATLNIADYRDLVHANRRRSTTQTISVDVPTARLAREILRNVIRDVRKAFDEGRLPGPDPRGS